ncbi:MAG: class I SAM-dependent methyltransferase [Acidobacteriia bacterium]|nr:class I SAM-dependent methyltransferase [Terriglobia bacterium]
MATDKRVSRSAGLYNERFYAAKNEGSYRSAMVVLPIVLSLVKPHSVVDVGCGTGTWLRAAEELGVDNYRGYDGSQSSQLCIPRERFAVADLTRPLQPSRRFDLALCCEVGEHLPADSAQTLIASLAAFSDVVLYSAAIPGQGGTHHVNEQWPAYWQALFRAQGYSAYDCIRAGIWNDDRVEFWYRQNTVLYVADSAASRFALPAKTEEVLALVHPALYESQRRKKVLKTFLRNTKQSLARITGRQG